MPSSIRLIRICEYCGKEFEARTTVTRTCGNACAKLAYRARQKAGKVEASNHQTQTSSQINELASIKTKEFLTVRDAAKLLNSSRQTIYNLIQSGSLPAVNISVKKTLITRSAIDQLFAAPSVTPLLPAAPVETFPLEECYTLQQAREKYGLSDKALYELIRRNTIPKQYKGKHAYVPKHRIDALLAEANVH